MSSHWWIELGLGPLVARAACSGVSRQLWAQEDPRQHALTPPTELIGLRCPGTCAYRLLGGARFWR